MVASNEQVRYAATEIAPSKSARARGAYLRVSFKNTRETAQAINGWKLQRAVTFLENVKEKKEAVPFRRYAGSIGRTAQGTNKNLVLRNSIYTQTTTRLKLGLEFGVQASRGSEPERAGRTKNLPSGGLCEADGT